MVRRVTAENSEENDDMKKTIRKRLTLDRDTVKALVVELSTAELPHVRGGVLQPGLPRPLTGGSGTIFTLQADGVVVLC
jgi:hypothetical protein